MISDTHFTKNIDFSCYVKSSSVNTGVILANVISVGKGFYTEYICAIRVPHCHINSINLDRINIRTTTFKMLHDAEMG